MVKECEIKIEPCPFCGCKDISVKILNEDKMSIVILIQCNNPKCNMSAIFSWCKNSDHPEWNKDIYIALSIGRWNKRADNSEKDATTKIKLHLPEPERYKNETQA